MTDYIEKFAKLRVNTSGGVSPHKPCLLLAVIDLAEAGGLEENEIQYRPELIERFNEYFNAVKSERDHPNVFMPFFHLRGDGFWHLQPLKGREIALDTMSTAVKHSDITENIKAASLDPELHALLLDQAMRQELRASLIAHWFGDRADSVWKVVRAHESENEKEQALRSLAESKPGEVKDEEIPARTAAFRRVVLQAYDYRCAATGWRNLVPGGTTLMEAAHIVPWSDSYNDDPRNGIALSPTYHKALDRNLIAPGPDMKWHVSPIFDGRIADNQLFLELEGQDIIYIGNEKYRPSKDYLEVRVEMLRTE